MFLEHLFDTIFLARLYSTNPRTGHFCASIHSYVQEVHSNLLCLSRSILRMCKANTDPAIRLLLMDSRFGFDVQDARGYIYCRRL